jgi:bla regulator protein BlaR1
MTPTIREFVLAMGSSLPASMVAKATIIAAFGLMGARLARRSRAAVRHVLLAATFTVLLLLPVASLIVPPVRIAVPTAWTSSAVSSAPAVGGKEILPFTPPEARPAETSAALRSSCPPLIALVVMGWLAGVALALIPLIASLWKIRWLRRSGLPWAAGRKVANRILIESDFCRGVDVLLHEALPGPIVSGMLRPAVLFPLDAQTWGTEDLNRALVHELEHVQRGDVLTHCLARVICAVYWFHPLVWMAWRQLILEAERSCDDAVIARWEATAYASQLVALARRLVTAARSPLLALANRSDLATRVGAVLDTHQRRGRAGSPAVALGCTAAAVLAFTISPLKTVSSWQSATAKAATHTLKATGEPSPSFEVISIKSEKPGRGISGMETPPGRFSATNVTAKGLIAYAYNYHQPGLSLMDYQILGGSEWISSNRFDIEAEVEDSLVEQDEKKKLPVNEWWAQVRLRVQSMLADRFRLKVTRETNELPVYEVVVAKHGAKLTESTIPRIWRISAIARGPEFSIERGQLTGVGLSVGDLAGLLPRLSEIGGRKVVDRTGLQGRYDFTLKWTPEQAQRFGGPGPGAATGAGGGADEAGAGGAQLAAGKSAAPDTSGPSLFTAIEQQLGLSLKPSTGPVEVVVIDHIEHPSEN